MLTYKNIFLRVSSTKVKENTALIDRKEHWERCSLVSTFIHSFIPSKFTESSPYMKHCDKH